MIIHIGYRYMNICYDKKDTPKIDGTRTEIYLSENYYEIVWYKLFTEMYIFYKIATDIEQWDKEQLY